MKVKVLQFNYDTDISIGDVAIVNTFPPDKNGSVPLLPFGCIPIRFTDLFLKVFYHISSDNAILFDILSHGYYCKKIRVVVYYL